MTTKPETNVRWQDVIIDRSPAEKAAWLIKVKAELFDLGYTVVRSDSIWLGHKR
jgi:hypothetical protein